MPSWKLGREAQSCIPILDLRVLSRLPRYKPEACCLGKGPIRPTSSWCGERRSSERFLAFLTHLEARYGFASDHRDRGNMPIFRLPSKSESGHFFRPSVSAD